MLVCMLVYGDYSAVLLLCRIVSGENIWIMFKVAFLRCCMVLCIN